MTLGEKKKSNIKLVWGNSLKVHFQDYCSNSIYAIKYLREAGRPVGERIFWIFIFVVTFSVNGYLIRQIWNKWNDSLVIASLGETTTPVWNVPFPAVTICSEVKSRSKLFNFDYHISNYLFYENDTEKEIKQRIGDITLLCDDHVIADGAEYANRSTIDFLMEVSPPFSELVWKCEWKNVKTSCSSMFTKVLTEDGFCYTFNMLDKADLLRGDPFPDINTHGHRAYDWSLDGGYDKNRPLDAYPFRTFSAGAKAGLTFRMRSRVEDRDLYCRGPVSGFKILLHNPSEIPMVRERYLRSPLNQEVVVVVQPEIMTTSNSLRSYPPHTRHCYFPSERYLAFFQVYTQSNCELECLTNFTRLECGCVGLHMPRREETKICGAGKKECMIKAAEKLRINEISASYSKAASGSCACLPACTSIRYNFEKTQTKFASEAVLQDDDDGTMFQESRFSIFFGNLHFATIQKREWFGNVDFIAYFGGLVSLCCGISFLSILQLIYYLTLRVRNNLVAKERKDEWERNHEIDSDSEVNETEYACKPI